MVDSKVSSLTGPALMTWLHDHLLDADASTTPLLQVCLVLLFHTPSGAAIASPFPLLEALHCVLSINSSLPCIVLLEC